MNKLTYKEAFDKITEAYIKGEIEPYKCQFCFCGTLHGDKYWVIPEKEGPYTLSQYNDMEAALLNTLSNNCRLPKEERLFNGMSAALDVLKQIHKERGENVEDFQFTKREIEQIQNQTV